MDVGWIDCSLGTVEAKAVPIKKKVYGLGKASMPKVVNCGRKDVMK